MAFSDSLTTQQKNDFLQVNGINFDTFVQRLVSVASQQAIVLRQQQVLARSDVQTILAQVAQLTPTQQDQIVAQLQTIVSSETQVVVQQP